MSEAFTFKAQPELMVTEEEVVKTLVGTVNSKRVRNCNDVGNPMEREMNGVSFKSKLMGMANPSSWAGFGEKKEKVLIREEDTMISDGPYGLTMTIAPDLK
ncbi:hypothetical protein ACOSQ4_002207 [Xanthoceras sorbifolium]